MEAFARSRGVPVAVLVRTALAEWLASSAASGDALMMDASLETRGMALPNSGIVKVTLRMPTGSSAKLAHDARAAEVSQGLYVARLLEGLPSVPAPVDLKETRHALLRSTATLAALCSDLQALERSLSQSRWVDLEGCKTVTDSLAIAVHQHLALASSVLSALAPPRRSSGRMSISA